jgi:uncharacterized membrane protein
MNPAASHWLRMSVWLLLATPIVAFVISLTTPVSFMLALLITLYIWAIVCVILALIAVGGLAVRLLKRGWRAVRG